MTRILISLLIFFSINFNYLKAQHQFGLKTDVGIAMLKKNANEDLEFERLEKVGPSFNIGLLYNFLLTKRWYIMTEAKLSMLYSSSEYVACPSCNDPSVDPILLEVNQTDKLFYLALPLSVGYKFNSFLIKTGFQYGINLKSEYEIKLKEYQSSQSSFSQKGNHDFKNDFGLLVGLMYYTGSKTSISLNYYHGINNLCDCEDSEIKYSNRQLTFGFQYLFHTIEKAPTE